MIRLSARFLPDRSTDHHGPAVAGINRRIPVLLARIQRLLRLAIQRAAHRHEHWLEPVQWNAGSRPFREPYSLEDTARRRNKS